MTGSAAAGHSPACKLLDVDGGQIAWWEDGTGPQAILWVHGLPLDSRSWELQRRHFVGRARNLFIDLRGYGRSSKLPRSERDVTDLYAQDVARVIEAAGGKKILLVGFASAGHVALRFAARRGDLLAGLVVINGSPRFMRAEDWPFGFDQTALDAFAAPLRRGEVEPALDRILAPETAFQDVTPGEADRLAAWFRPMGEAAGATTLLGFFDGIAHDDDRGLLDEITVPTLLITSSRGKEVPSGVAMAMRRRIRSAQLAELAGSDHFVFATRPALINALIDDFASGLGSSPSA